MHGSVDFRLAHLRIRSYSCFGDCHMGDSYFKISEGSHVCIVSTDVDTYS